MKASFFMSCRLRQRQRAKQVGWVETKQKLDGLVDGKLPAPKDFPPVVHFDPTWNFPQMKVDTTEVAFPVNIWFLFDLCGENPNTKSKDKSPLLFQIVPVKGFFRVGE